MIGTAVGIGVALLALLVTGEGDLRRSDAPFRLAKPKAATIRELGQVKGPKTHECRDDEGYAMGGCFDYVGGWCQAPCTTYSVLGTVVSVRRLTGMRSFGNSLVVLRDGGATIAARARLSRKWRAGDRVRVSGVLFFPRSRRDGAYAPNGAELSPLYAMTHV